MHMEEVIYDLKRSIDRMRNIHPIKQDSIVPNNPLGIPNELAVKTGLDRAALTPNAIRDILGAVTNKITQSIDKEMMDEKPLNDDVFMEMKLLASMSRDELIELIHKLRAKINEMTPPRPINTYGPDFKPAPPKRTMKELEGETPIQGI